MKSLAVILVFLWVGSAAADDLGEMFCPMSDSLLQEVLSVEGSTATDPEVETRVVFVSFPGYQRVLPDWSDSLANALADYIETMSGGDQTFKISVLARPDSASVAWVADSVASYYQQMGSGLIGTGYAVLNAEIMSKIDSAISDVWDGVEQVFMLHYQSVFKNSGVGGVSGLGCSGTGCAPGFSGGGTTQRLEPGVGLNEESNEKSMGWIAGHEYGHRLGFPHSPSPGQVNMGRYDIMVAYGSWARGEGLTPYHPLHLSDVISWKPKVTLTTDSTGFRIPDLLTLSGFTLSVPASANQSFLLANHQGNNPYNAKYLGMGLLIWHRSQNYFWDLERAAGKFDSTGVCQLDYNSPDPVVGQDLLENCSSYKGSSADFFDGQSKTAFECSTNPHTFLYETYYQYYSPQSVSTSVAFENIHRDTNGDMLVDVFVTPKQSVTAPNGGEYLTVAHATNVQWSVRSAACIDSVAIAVSQNGGGDYSTVASGLSNAGQYSWTPLWPGSQYRVRVRSYDEAGGTGNDESNANFTVRPNPVSDLAVID